MLYLIHPNILPFTITNVTDSVKKDTYKWQSHSYISNCYKEIRTWNWYHWYTSGKVSLSNWSLQNKYAFQYDASCPCIDCIPYSGGGGGGAGRWPGRGWMAWSEGQMDGLVREDEWNDEWPGQMGVMAWSGGWMAWSEGVVVYAWSEGGGGCLTPLKFTEWQSLWKCNKV